MLMNCGLVLQFSTLNYDNNWSPCPPPLFVPATTNVTVSYIANSNPRTPPLDQQTQDKIRNDLNKRVRTYNYADQRIKGAIYAGRNFNAGLAAAKDSETTSLSGTHNFVLEGNLIANGNDNDTGNINISGFEYNRLYVDPASTALLSMLRNATKLKRIMWASW